MNSTRSTNRILGLTLGLLFGFVLLAVVSGNTSAQETTGRVEGIVSDASGARVPEATVRVEGPAYVTTVTTDKEGFFRILKVPPGTYKVTVTAANFSTAVIEAASVVLGKTTEVNFSLKVGQVSEQIVITGDDVVRIDPTDNKIQTNITARQIEALPKGTNFTSLLKLSPAARPEPLSGQFQIDGASGSENNFIIDGQEVANFRTGVLNANNNLPFQFIQEVQIKTSGFEAEFGGATGGVINVVTKGGSNDWHGEASYQFEPGSMWAGPRQTLQAYRGAIDGSRPATGSNYIQINNYIRGKRDNFFNHYPSGTISGPLVKDRVWFLGSYAPQIFKTTREAKYYNVDPRLRTNVLNSQTYRNTTRNEYAFGRIDAAPFDKLRLSSTYTWNPIIQQGIIPGSTNGNLYIGGAPPSANFGGIGNLSGSALTDRQGGRQNSSNVTFQAVYTPTSRLVTTFRFTRGFLNEKLGSYFIPSETRFICSGTQPPAGAGCSLGFQNISTNSQVSYDASFRTNYDADASYLVSNLGGRHEFKGGYQHSTLSNKVLRGYIPFGIVQLYYGQTINDLTGRNDAVTPGSIGAGSLTRIGTQGDASNTAQSVYIQDKWQPTSRLSINAGVRIEKENLPSFNGFAPPINFGFGDKVAPRLGFAYDLLGDGKTKLFASWGRFYDRLKFELPRGSFGGDFYRVDYFEISPSNPAYNYYTLPRILGNNQDVINGKCPIANSSGLTRCQYDFRIASNNPDASIEDGKVDPNMKPFRQTEFTIGFEREFVRSWLASARYTFKNVDSAIEDAGFPTAQGSEAYIIGNPGIGLHAAAAQQFGYVKTTTPQRRYDALEVRIDRRFVNKVFFFTSYTFSRLYGNYSGLASSDENGRTSPGVNRFFDLPHLGFTAAGLPDNGRLATDRPHVWNAYGGYDFNWFEKAKKQSTLVSFFTTAQSGTPLTSLYTFYAASILRGRGDLGRSPGFTQTDFSLSHKVRFTERYNLAFDFNVINIFNESNILGRVNTPSNVSTSIAGLGLPSAVDNEPKAINYVLTNGILSNFEAFYNNPATPERKNTALGLANSYQAGRQVRFALRFSF